jgi:energy-coupling factor transport system permease protein
MHPGAWAAWVTMVMVVALATTNPLYLALLLLCVLVVATFAPRTGTGATSFRALLIFGFSMMVLSVLIATINGNYGDHILFTVPGPEIPRWLGGLRLGGPVSAEGLAAAAIRGLAIICIFLAFGVFNGAVSPHRILRSTPGALFQASLVLTVGLTLLPSSIEDFRRIREMRALRGAPGGLRGLPALVVPAVINGLERSMQLAEAMEARGYAASHAPSPLARLLAAASAPLLVAAAWLWFYSEGWREAGAALAVLGAAFLAAWLFLASRAHRTTSFEDDPLSWPERIGVSVSAAAVLLVIALRAADGGALLYNPFAGLAVPEFSAAAAALVLSALWPTVVLIFTPAVAPARQPAPPAAPEVAL